jgi:hypothetical protein
MTFSARSFALVVRSRSWAASSAGVAPRGAGALDRPRLDRPVGYAPQEPFRRRAEHLEVAEVEVRGERRRVHGAQPPVQVERVFAERREQPLRQVHLEAVAGVDVLDRAGDGGFVARAIEAAGYAGEGGEWVLRHRLDGRLRERRVLELRFAVQLLQQPVQPPLGRRDRPRPRLQRSNATTQSYRPTAMSGAANSSARGFGVRSSSRPRP